MKKLGSVINAQQFDKETIDKIFFTAAKMEKEEYDSNLLRGKKMLTLFYEPSSRTRVSFEVAMMNLGGNVIHTNEIFSSVAKGESLEDTIRVMSDYGFDVIVLRYNKEGGAERAEKFSLCPVINAGDGPGQHPTQALLDIYTITKKFGKIENLNIAMVGDLVNGRTVRSLCYFLAKHFPKNKIFFISPQQVKMRDDIKAYLDKHGVKWEEMSEFGHILPELDVIYQTRVQKERFELENQEIFQEITEAASKLVISENTLAQLKKDAIITHPLPRVTEIKYSVDKDPRASYFKQSKNGLYIRMALLEMIIAGY